ncbi:MAG: M16 family metallopeptidase [Acidobacteriota bacterium]
MTGISNNLQVERLDNGLTVLLRPVHTAPLVSVWCWYHVGSKDETPGITGASHWVEHMNFKGTRSISREELKVWIERAGGFWNGYTWIDQTTYFETLAADSLDLALRIESERMTDCLYDPEEFESERTVIISELQGNENNPGYLLDVEVTAAAFRTHPYRWPTIGWLDDLQSMSRDDLLDHYRSYYVPANATLVIVGDVDPSVALASVEARFGDIPAGERPSRSPAREQNQEEERRVVVERPGTTRYLQVAFHAPAFTDDDFVPLLVADAVLSGGKGVNLWSGGHGRSARTTSPLYAGLVEPELVSVISSALLPTEQSYLYTIAATVRADVAEATVEEALFAALAGVAETPPSERLLQKAKNQLLAALAFENEGVTQVAHQLGYFATIARHQLVDELPDRINATTSEQVRQAAASRWAPQRRTVGWFRPLEAE